MIVDIDVSNTHPTSGAPCVALTLRVDDLTTVVHLSPDDARELADHTRALLWELQHVSEALGIAPEEWNGPRSISRPIVEAIAKLRAELARLPAICACGEARIAALRAVVIDDDPEDDVPCIACGRVDCTCDEGIDEEENRA